MTGYNIIILRCECTAKREILFTDIKKKSIRPNLILQQ